MTIDYDTWLLEGSDEEYTMLCPICEYNENEVECEHDEQAKKDWHEEEKGEAMYEAMCSKMEEEDLNAEVNF